MEKDYSERRKFLIYQACILAVRAAMERMEKRLQAVKKRETMLKVVKQEEKKSA